MEPGIYASALLRAWMYWISSTAMAARLNGGIR